MRGFSAIFFAIVITFVLIGCEKKSSDGVAKMHWDRDMCERCKMAISERKFAVQVIDPKSGKVYKFDDIGCAFLWFDDENISWEDKAKIFITDAKTGKWLDAKKTIYTDDSITPMAFGFAAYTKETLPKNHHTVKFDEIKKKVIEIEKLNVKKIGEQK